MSIRTATLAAITVVATAGSLAWAGPAAAAQPAPIFYVGISGGTKATAASGLVTSGLTAASFVEGITYPATDANTVASATIEGLLTTGTIHTSENATRTSTGAQLVSAASTDDTSLLDGAITVGAIDTTSTATVDGSNLTASTDTQFANIQIANVDLPVHIPANFTVTIPGVASVVLNYTATFNVNGAVSTLGAGIMLTLLADRNGYGAGAEVFVNPVLTGLATHIPNTPVLLGGTTYGTQVTAGADGIAGITSGMTARQDLSSAGTDGQTLVNSTAGVNVPDILVGGAIRTTVEGTTSNTTGTAHTTAKVASVNVLDGLIKVKAVNVEAKVHARSAKNIRVSDTTTFVGLIIAGHKYPLKVTPNTVINLAGLGTVTLNEQTNNGFYTQVRGIVVTLTTARAGLPVGAVIEIGVSSAYVID